MKSIRCVEPGKLEYAETSIPVPEDGRVVLKVRRVGICGTDIHAFDGSQPYFSYPRILGHEIAAEIVDGKTLGEFSVGDTVTVMPYFNCGNCASCRIGKPNCCVQLKVCGVHIDGAMCEFISVPATHLVASQGITLDELALVEPFAIAAHGIRRAEIKSGETVLVVGAGPIGMAAMEIASRVGANVVAMDINETRLNFCRNKINISNTLNPEKIAVKEALQELTNGDMPSVVIDATGSLTAINKSFAFMGHGARYVLIGLQKGHISFDHPEFHKREGSLMSSRNATRVDFDFVIENFAHRKLKPAEYVTHRVAFQDMIDQFPAIRDPANNVIKAVVHVS